MLLPTKMGANNHEDMVIIHLGHLQPCIPYQTALELAQNLRVLCKYACRFDHEEGSFWSDVDMEDLDDCPVPHRGFRRGVLGSNVKQWSIRVSAQIIEFTFDGEGVEMDYESGIKLHQKIRRAARRAKAWAGDTSKGVRMLSYMTSAGDDHQLGLN